MLFVTVHDTKVMHIDGIMFFTSVLGNDNYSPGEVCDCITYFS